MVTADREVAEGVRDVLACKNVREGVVAKPKFRWRVKKAEGEAAWGTSIEQIQWTRFMYKAEKRQRDRVAANSSQRCCGHGERRSIHKHGTVGVFVHPTVTPFHSTASRARPYLSILLSYPVLYPSARSFTFLYRVVVFGGAQRHRYLFANSLKLSLILDHIDPMCHHPASLLSATDCHTETTTPTVLSNPPCTLNLV